MSDSEIVQTRGVWQELKGRECSLPHNVHCLEAGKLHFYSHDTQLGQNIIVPIYWGPQPIGA